MCFFKYGLSVEHDSVDPRHLLEDHQHDPDHQRFVDTGILQVGHLEARALRENQRPQTSGSVQQATSLSALQSRL